MIIHAMDSLPAYEAVISQPASAAIGGRPLIDSSRMVALGERSSRSDVAMPSVAAGLCFVRPGSGGWQGVIAVCDDGRMSTLADVRRPALTPALFHPAASSAGAGRAASVASHGGIGSWSTWLSAALLSLGLALSIKYAAMTLGTSGHPRRIG